MASVSHEFLTWTVSTLNEKQYSFPWLILWGFKTCLIQAHKSKVETKQVNKQTLDIFPEKKYCRELNRSERKDQRAEHRGFHVSDTACHPLASLSRLQPVGLSAAAGEAHPTQKGRSPVGWRCSLLPSWGSFKCLSGRWPEMENSCSKPLRDQITCKRECTDRTCKYENFVITEENYKA